MRLLPLLAPLGLAALLSAPQAQAAGEVYKWKDDAGVVHYTDAPPEGRAFEKMKITTGKPATESNASPVVEAVNEAATAERPAGTAEANCASATRNVENMERFTEISMDRDGDGTAEKLTAEERVTELERNRALVKLFCQQEAAPAGTGDEG